MNLRAANDDSSDGGPLAQQRRGEYGSRPTNFLSCLGIWKLVFRLRREVMNVDGLPVGHSPANRRAASDRQRVAWGGHQPIFRHTPEGVSIDSKYYSVKRIA